MIRYCAQYTLGTVSDDDLGQPSHIHDAPHALNCFDLLLLCQRGFLQGESKPGHAGVSRGYVRQATDRVDQPLGHFLVRE